MRVAEICCFRGSQACVPVSPEKFLGFRKNIAHRKFYFAAQSATIQGDSWCLDIVTSHLKPARGSHPARLKPLNQAKK